MGRLLGGRLEGSSRPPLQPDQELGPGLKLGSPVWAEGLCALLDLFAGAKSLLRMRAQDPGAL